jgi:hypothetical protein
MEITEAIAALAALGQVLSHWRGIAVTVSINWLVKPFSMALLGWLFVGYLFRPLLPAGHIAGLILLAAAPCTAMVFVWSNLVEGEPHFTLSQIALNDTIMVVAFAPIVALLLGKPSGLSGRQGHFRTAQIGRVRYVEQRNGAMGQRVRGGQGLGYGATGAPQRRFAVRSDVTSDVGR